MYRRRHPDSQLSLQEGTAAVPCDGYYYVLRGAEVLSRHRALKRAARAYEDLISQEVNLNAVPPPPEASTIEHVASPVSGYFCIYGKSRRQSARTRTHSG